MTVVLAAASDPDSRRILALAVVFIIAGLGFKLSLVPFHAWTPEAFGGASVPVGAFLAITSKVAAFAALLLIFREVNVLGASAFIAIGVFAGLSMTVGNTHGASRTTHPVLPRVVDRFASWVGGVTSCNGVQCSDSLRRRIFRTRSGR